VGNFCNYTGKLHTLSADVQCSIVLPGRWEPGLVYIVTADSQLLTSEIWLKIWPITQPFTSVPSGCQDSLFILSDTNSRKKLQLMGQFLVRYYVRFFDYIFRLSVIIAYVHFPYCNRVF
jgi:hypothetical protein